MELLKVFTKEEMRPDPEVEAVVETMNNVCNYDDHEQCLTFMYITQVSHQILFFKKMNTAILSLSRTQNCCTRRDKAALSSYIELVTFTYIESLLE